MNPVMMDLGTLGGSNSAAWMINMHGEMVGWAAMTNGSHHAFFMTNFMLGGMMDLGTAGGTNSEAYCINSNRMVVGYAMMSEREHAANHVHQRHARELEHDDHGHGRHGRFGRAVLVCQRYGPDCRAGADAWRKSSCVRFGQRGDDGPHERGPGHFGRHQQRRLLHQQRRQCRRHGAD